MFGNGGGIQQSFEDGGQVPNRNLFPQQLLQYFLHLSQAQNLGRQFFDKFRLAVRKAVEQALGLLPGEQFVRMLPDLFSRMRGQNRGLIHHDVAGSPLGHFLARYLHTAERHHVLARLQAEIVGDVNRRHHEAQLQREVIPGSPHARQQLSPLRYIHQRDQCIADLTRYAGAPAFEPRKPAAAGFTCDSTPSRTLWRESRMRQFSSRLRASSACALRVPGAGQRPRLPVGGRSAPRISLPR